MRPEKQIHTWLALWSGYCSAESRPWDGGAGGHPDPEIRMGGAVPKKIFQPFGTQFCLKIGGSKGGAVVRALASHQCSLGSNPGDDAICGLSLLLVLSLATRGFSPGTPVFPSPQKPTFPNSNSTRNQVDEEPLCRCATCKWLFI